MHTPASETSFGPRSPARAKDRMGKGPVSAKRPGPPTSLGAKGGRHSLAGRIRTSAAALRGFRPQFCGSIATARLIMPLGDSAEPVGAFHDSANLNLAKRRLCAALGISLGSSEHCCAISVARARAALTAAIPRSSRPLARRTNFGAAKSCSLVIIFMIRPPTAQSGKSHYAQPPAAPLIGRACWPPSRNEQPRRHGPIGLHAGPAPAEGICARTLHSKSV